MKKQDIAMIILIASLSMVAAYFAAGAIPGLKDNGKPEKVRAAEVINSKVSELDKDIFSDNAINPTVKVRIGTDKPENEKPQPR